MDFDAQLYSSHILVSINRFLSLNVNRGLVKTHKTFVASSRTIFVEI